MDGWQQGGWGWFALALVNAGLAEQKNRSRLNWFLLSLLLGPFATAYIVMTAKPEASTAAGPTVIEPHMGLWVMGVLLLGGGVISGMFALATPWLWFVAVGCVALAATAGILAWKVAVRSAA
ncbi:hypothetical protein BMH32_07855 [Leucobacter sp. OLJS4]|uniref:hypothetical protein n=1 Tax=Leucobacter sp. OLJS4 TaxID=1914922 RepID=UPI000C19A9C1|nr:hypothetical protein [Leucobacter sp. OLJS4]PIJ11121.1 hypothetical protein BMH32_07855 [Leucobacter sp. OLJS4]